METIEPVVLDMTRLTFTWRPMLDRINEWRARRPPLCIAFTNGCFDLFHAGHLSLLETARAHGNRLVVGVNSDESVRRLKGADRPFIPFTQRAAILCALRCVDAVALFEDEGVLLELIKLIRPDVIVKGADYEACRVVGAEFAKVVIVERRVAASTSDIVRRIRDEFV